MRRLYRAALLASMLVAWPVAVTAAEVRISPNDTIESALNAQKGRVTLRLRSGQEITGTVRAVTGKLVHLGALTGREFFDAVVPIESIEAIIVRTKE